VELAVLGLPKGLGFENGQFMEQIIAGKALVALNQVQVILVGPMEIEGADRLGLYPCRFVIPRMRPDIDRRRSGIVPAAGFHIIGISLPKDSMELGFAVAQVNLMLRRLHRFAPFRKRRDIGAAAKGL
jgi:hypothetical protein